MTKSVFQFGGGSADGDASQRNLLGGKGANLAEMAGIGLPVPPFSFATPAPTTRIWAYPASASQT